MWESTVVASMGNEDALQSSLYHTERDEGVEGLQKGGAKEWLNTKNTEQKRHGRMGLRDWMLKRDSSKEDLDWETERKAGQWTQRWCNYQAQSKEGKREAGKSITMIIGP